MELLIRHPALRCPPRTEAVPRPGGGTRQLVRLDPADADTYRRLVAQVSQAVERALGPRVLAHRVVGPSLRLEDWRDAYRRWRRAIDSGSAGGLRVGSTGGLRMHLDVADCYGSIRPEVVAAALTGEGAPIEGLSRFLHELADHGVRGLPVGPEPSAVLANAVLRRLDVAVAAAGAPHVRWVDDVVAMVEGRREAQRVLDAARRALEELGLRPNEAKTRVEDRRSRPRIAMLSPPTPCDDAAP